MGTLGAQALEERDETTDTRMVAHDQMPEVSRLIERQDRTMGVVGLGTPVVPVVTEPTSGPAPEPVDEPPPTPAATPATTEPESQGSIEQAICAYPWECGIALRVAACESGPDYVAGYNNSGHAGTFQISPIHAWRFTDRGLNFWNDALVLQVNLDVAFEIWTERWWWAWSCF